MLEIKAGIGVAKYFTDILINEHRLYADEPIEQGGFEKGPNPFEYLGAALSACTLITMKMYADRKAWPDTNFNVQIEYENAGFENQKILRKISIPNSYSQEQKLRLLEIANKCPVHKILKNNIVIESILVE